METFSSDELKVKAVNTLQVDLMETNAYKARMKHKSERVSRASHRYGELVSKRVDNALRRLRNTDYTPLSFIS